MSTRRFFKTGWTYDTDSRDALRLLVFACQPRTPAKALPYYDRELQFGFGNGSAAGGGGRGTLRLPGGRRIILQAGKYLLTRQSVFA